MRDNQKTKDELLQEVKTLHKRVAKLTQTEKLLRESEEKWRSLLNNTPDIVMIVDHDGTIRFINHTVPGITVQETIGKKVYDFISSEHHEKMRKDLERIFQTGHGASQEISGVGPHGGLSWYQADLGPIRQDGRIVAASIVTRDITERNRAGDVLKKSEQRFRSLVEVTSDWVWEVDKNGVYTYASPKIKELLGYEPEEIIGKTPFDLMPPDEAERVGAIFRDIMISRKPFERLENRNLHKDGRLIVLETNSVPIFDASGGFTGYRGIDRDITEHKRMEEALRESEKQFREIFENIAVGVYRTTPDGQILMANPALVHMLGYSSFEEFSQRNLEEEGFEPQYQRSTFKEEIEREGRIVSSESTWIRRDGKKLHVIENARAVRDEDGKTLYYEGTAEDITERKKADEALRESEERYRTLVESAGESIAVVNKDGVHLFINETAAKRLGGKPEDYVGKTIWDAFPKKIADRQMAIIRKVISKGEGINSISPIELHGQFRWFNAAIEPLRDGSGKVTAAMVIARDIHELKLAEEELGLYREKMARAERLASVGTLSAIMAHTLNNPLTAIQLSIQNAMAESKKTPRQSIITKYLKDSLRSVSEVSSTVRSLGKFASESSKEIISEVNIKAVAERTVKLLSESARRAKMSLHLEGMEKLPPIYSNEKDLEQLFFSLVENAIQAADGKKNHRLIISGAVKDKHIELRFTDNCGGITQENLDKIFEPFFTTNPPGEGTGLGLCIVDRFVSETGGKIRVESKAGKGSTFFVTLPTSRGTRY